MRLMYIAGKFTDKSVYRQEQNIRLAEEAAVNIIKSFKGEYMPVIPHSMTRNLDDSELAPWDFWMNGMLQLLDRCDAVLFLPNWRDSKGAIMEHDYAVDTKKEIFYYGIPRR